VETLFANQLESVLDEAQTQAVLEILNKIGLREWLEQHPFTVLVFEEKVFIFEREVSGYYNYRTSEARIAVTREPTEYNQVLEWGRTDKLSNTATSLLQAIQFTLLHEVGHRVHAVLQKADVFGFEMSLRAVKSNAATNYAKTPASLVEYFAETFVAWVLCRTELFIYDNLGYGMIYRALRVLELEVREYDS
jgi:hypothetical protein